MHNLDSNLDWKDSINSESEPYFPVSQRQDIFAQQMAKIYMYVNVFNLDPTTLSSGSGKSPTDCK